MKNRLFKAAENVIKKCLKVKSKEKVLIVTDPPCFDIGKIFWQVASTKSDPILVEIVPRKMHGEEPPAMVAKLLAECDVFILPTSMSLTHTRARKLACESGKRGATLPGITKDMMARTLNANYQKIKERSVKLAEVLTRAKTAWLTSKQGTNIRMSLVGRVGHPDTGIIHKPGDFSNLPAGEAYIAPLEGTAVGQVVVDGSMAPIGLLDKKLIFVVEKGLIKSIANDKGQFQKIFRKYGRKAGNVAELGIGTNDFARITGEVLEDEKVLGTVHIAFGNNFAFGGRVSVPVHLDGIIKEPTLYIDGKCVIKDGRHIF